MPAKSPIGHIACPECDHSDAEVKLDKNGKPYRYCPECNAQFFPRSPEAQQRLMHRMRPVTGSSAAAPPAAPAKPAKPASSSKVTPSSSSPAAAGLAGWLSGKK